MSESRKTLGAPLLLSGAALAFVAALGLGRLFGDQGAATDDASSTQTSAAVAGPRFKVPVSMSQPKLGADDALVTIVEWGDFRSAESRNARDVLKSLLEAYPATLRVVHRQLPTPTDPESMQVNYFARAAFDLAGKFWEVRDRLLDAPADVALTTESLRGIADEVGLDWNAIERGIEHKDFARYVGVDVLFAGKFGVDATPAFFVNGRRLPATRPEALRSSLEELLKAELAHAKTVAAGGVEPLKVYDAVIEDGLWSTDDNPAARKAANAALPTEMSQ